MEEVAAFDVAVHRGVLGLTRDGDDRFVELADVNRLKARIDDDLAGLLP